MTLARRSDNQYTCDIERYVLERFYLPWCCDEAYSLNVRCMYAMCLL